MSKTDSTIKATVATVAIGKIEFQGLMDTNGNFSVAVPQVAEQFSFPIKHASRDIKRLLGNDFSFPKCKTPLNSKAVNVIPLPNFEQLIRKLDKAGNKVAEAIVDDLVGLSLHQLFCDAFDIEFNKRDRKNWLVARQESKQAFWSLGDATKEYKLKHPERSEIYYTFLYSNCQDLINRGLFGKSAVQLRTELGVKDLLRNHYGEQSLRRINLVQAVAAANIVNFDIEPGAAVKQSLAMFNFEVTSYRE